MKQRSSTRTRGLLAALLLALASVAPAAAQAPPAAAPAAAPVPPESAAPSPARAKLELPPEVAHAEQLASAVVSAETAIQAAEKKVQDLRELEESLGRLRIDVESIIDGARRAAEQLRPQLDAVKSQIDKLGPQPAKDAPPESGAIAAERARLSAIFSALDGAVRSAEVAWLRSTQLIGKITVLRHALFTRNLVERLPSPLLPGIWRDLVSEAPAVGGRVTYLAEDWLQWAEAKRGQFLLLLAAAALLFVGVRYKIARITDRRHLRTEPPLPSFFERAKSAAWVAPLRALPAIAAGMLLYGGLDVLDLLFAPWGQSAGAVFKAVFVYAGLSSLIQAVLAPRSAQWRLVSLADVPTRRIGALLCAITAVWAIDAALTEISRAFYIPLALSVVQSFLASAGFAALLIGLLLTPFTPQAAAAPPEGVGADATQAAVSRHAPLWLKLPLWGIALAILALALLGYVALARFVAHQLVMTGIVIAVGWLLYLAIRAVTREPLQRSYDVGEMLEARFGLDAPRRNQLARLTEIALTFALIIAALPFLMLQWGFSGADIRDWFKSLFFGIEVGQFRISLARILLGILLFMVLLLATRLFQRWLREKALQNSRLDPGIANSIDTVAGYVGTALAALLAVSYAGLDITNLAIVAGALSVGIGFGLQSIVNNFVSGLILLIERPIKVGDWIVLGDQQGNVRRISVRATEIETFDRASLIIPNSELITGRVINWTHRNSMGRIILKIGVGYNSDPAQVMALLKACAETHPGVLAAPGPIATFDNFGDSALEFSLRVYLADIGQALSVQTELRVAMLQALREAGIEIPFNQVDVNLRDLEDVKRYLAQYLQERAAKPTEAAQPHAPMAGNGKRVAGE